MNVVKVKTELREFLLIKLVWHKFEANVIKYAKERPGWRYMNSGIVLEGIAAAFAWDESPEGAEYWRELTKEYSKLFN